MMKCWILLFTITFSSRLSAVSSQPQNPTANLSTSWINSANGSFYDGPTIQSILNRGSFYCGFYCNGPCDSYLFALFILLIDYRGITGGLPQVVWSASRNNPVGINASLHLTADGDLVLRHADGKLAWSSNTAGKGVLGLNLTELGNLVLFGKNSSVVWQSFDFPTDCLVPGQILGSGKHLSASASSTNWTEGGLFSVSMASKGLVASVQSDPPQVYYHTYSFSRSRRKSRKNSSYARLENGRLALYVDSVLDSSNSIVIPLTESVQYMKLGSDGHLRVFQLGGSFIFGVGMWKEAADILSGSLGECDYPMACGVYGVCSNGQCSCPMRWNFDGPSFKLINDKHPDRGCYPVNPLTCEDSDKHSFLDLSDVTYFTFVADIIGTDVDTCKAACLRNCSCKAAMFRYGENSSSGDCYLPTQIFSLINTEKDLTDYNNYSVSVKVQINATPRQSPPTDVENFPTPATGKSSLLRPVLGSTLGVFCVVVLIGAVGLVYRRRKTKAEDVEEDYLDHVPGMPTRFSFEELASATDNFSRKLGEGGFGSVYEGSFKDGMRIAVKRLDGVGHIRKSFLAEVETIGSIHHINLVTLVGFCADKSHRLLVYEYMCNGSLEKWIYNSNRETFLDWNSRRKIILDVAKGLAYLHEDCRLKILHLDIKPQNILLDEHYNAKLADFGLSKLVDRNQSKVVTTMRGTPGYLAPEWLNGIITEKVDVYSFGVVVLEIITGRKIFELPRPEEERHLLTLFKKKAEEGQWLDLVDKCCRDEECDLEEVDRLMQISAWCLQSDHEKRPSMSMVIKVIEGAKDVQNDVDYNFLISGTPETSSSKEVTPLPPSLLSGPR